MLYANASHSDQTGQDALSHLCRVYWRPVFTFITRRGYPPADAQDLTQDFFVHILQSDFFKRADPVRGRFRSLLLKSLQNFLLDAITKSRAAKRGGGLKFVPWDEWMSEAPAPLLPSRETEGWAAEKLYDLQWAVTVAGQALRRLREECESRGHRRLFDELSPCLTGDREAVSYADTAVTLNLTRGALKTLVHRLRQRYGALLREEVADTVQDVADLDEEVRYLCSVLSARDSV